MTFQQILNNIRNLLKDPGSGMNAYHTDDFIFQAVNTIQEAMATYFPPAMLSTLQRNYQFDIDDQVSVDWGNLRIGTFDLPVDATTGREIMLQIYDIVYRHANSTVESGYDEQPVKLNPILSPYQIAQYVQPKVFNPVAWTGYYTFQAGITPTKPQLILCPALEQEDDRLHLQYITRPTEMTEEGLSNECLIPGPLQLALPYFAVGYVLLSSMTPDLDGGQRAIQQGQSITEQYAHALGLNWERWRSWVVNLTLPSVPG